MAGALHFNLLPLLACTIFSSISAINPAMNPAMNPGMNPAANPANFGAPPNYGPNPVPPNYGPNPAAGLGPQQDYYNRPRCEPPGQMACEQACRNKLGDNYNGAICFKPRTCTCAIKRKVYLIPANPRERLNETDYGNESKPFENDEKSMCTPDQYVKCQQQCRTNMQTNYAGEVCRKPNKCDCIVTEEVMRALQAYLERFQNQTIMKNAQKLFKRMKRSTKDDRSDEESDETNEISDEDEPKTTHHKQKKHKNRRSHHKTKKHHSRKSSGEYNENENDESVKSHKKKNHHSKKYSVEAEEENEDESFARRYMHTTPVAATTTEIVIEPWLEDPYGPTRYPIQYYKPGTQLYHNRFSTRILFKPTDFVKQAQVRYEQFLADQLAM